MFIKVREFGVTPHALMFDPQLYIFDFDHTSKLTRFLVVEEQHLDLAPFIDIRFEAMAKCSFALPTAELIALDNQHGMERPRSSFIFHHAFVCSTLLARCLSQAPAFFSLKEPWILRRLADIKRHSGMKIPDQEWQRLFCMHLALLAKNYRSGKSPVIKATNVANNLIGDVLRFLPDQKSLYLYSDLESFLVSNLKKTAETQQKLPDLARSFIGDEGFALRYPRYCEIAQLPFLQVCALVWLSSLYNFCVTVDRFPNRKVRTLDMDEFLERPADVVSALSNFFDHDPDSGELAAMVGPGVMNSNAKHPGQTYGKELRRVEAEQVIASNRREIDRALAWASPLEQELALLSRMKSRRLLQSPGEDKPTHLT